MHHPRHFVWLLLACLITTKGQAADFRGEFQVAPRLSIGIATVRDEFAEPQRSESLITGGGFTVGYLAPFHLVVEAGLQFQGETVPVLDDGAFDIFEISLLAGLDIPLGAGWHLSPKFGRVNVTVQPRDEGFLPSDDYISGIVRSERSSDVYELSLRKHFEEHFALGVSYRELELPDGRSRTVGAEFVLRF